jgi:hypothetical protein
MRRSSWYLALANACGIATYTYFLLKIIRGIRAEQRTGPDFGDSLAFMMTGLPVLAFFFIVDMLWATVAVIQHRKHKDERESILVGTGSLAAWVFTVFAERYIF